VRYEDQPTTTRAFLAGTFDVVPEVVYHWRIRQDGSSITQQRASTTDLRDRWRTKRMALDAVQEYDDPATSAYFVDRVMAGDLHRYFVEIPGASDEWWRLLVDGHPTTSGASARGAQRPPSCAPAGRLARRAGPAGRRGVRGAVARTLDGPAPEGRRPPRRPALRARPSPASTPPPSACATSSGEVVSRLVAGAPRTSTTESVRWLRL
jgi:CDP-glycerol glycerophosphotransferase